MKSKFGILQFFMALALMMAVAYATWIFKQQTGPATPESPLSFGVVDEEPVPDVHFDLISTEAFDKEVLGAKGLVLVDFYADWCGPCKVQEKVLKRIADQMDGCRIVKVNVDQSPELAEKFAVSAIPRLIMFRDGIQADERLGVSSKDDLLAMVRQ
jgi:thioredoxin 1